MDTARPAGARRSVPAGLRLAVALCVALRALVLGLEVFALYVTSTFDAGVAAASRTGLDAFPGWVAPANLFLLYQRDTIGYALWLVFFLLFAVALHRAAASLTHLGVERPWSARIMPLALFVPYVNLVLPWIGLHATRLALRRVEDPAVFFDIPTLVFAGVFDLKLLGDRVLQVPDLQPNVFQGPPRAWVYWVNADKAFNFGVDAGLSALLLIALWLFWRAFTAQYAISWKTRMHATF